MTVPNSSKRTVMLYYYVPSTVRIKAPCPILRKLGFVRCDGSVWFGLEEMVPAVPLDEWRAAGARTEFVPCHPEQWEFIRRRALDHLEAEAAEVRAGIDQQLADARQRLEEAEALQSAKGVKKSTGKARAWLRHLRKKIEYAGMAASMFDLVYESGPLFEAVRATLAVQEEEWFVRFAQLKAKEKEDAA